MVNQVINSIDYKELYTQYNWFANNYPQVVQASSDEFFLKGLQFILIGISKNINTLMDKEAYFVLINFMICFLERLKRQLELFLIEL